jgi:hypothetical protein
MEISTKCIYFQNLKKQIIFLKIENTEETMTLKNKNVLNKIESISTVYSVDMNKIKSKKQFLIHMITNKKKKFDLHVGTREIIKDMIDAVLMCLE